MLSRLLATSTLSAIPAPVSSTAITPVNASVSLNRSGIRDIKGYATQRPASSAHLSAARYACASSVGSPASGKWPCS